MIISNAGVWWSFSRSLNGIPSNNQLISEIKIYSVIHYMTLQHFSNIKTWWRTFIRILWICQTCFTAALSPQGLVSQTKGEGRYSGREDKDDESRERERKRAEGGGGGGWQCWGGWEERNRWLVSGGERQKKGGGGGGGGGTWAKMDSYTIVMLQCRSVFHWNNQHPQKHDSW